MVEILHQRLPEDMRQVRGLPGIQPVEGSWLRWDEAYGAQMARREALLRDPHADVVYLEERARPAAEELLAAALTEAGFEINDGYAQRPDGVWVEIERSDPMGTLGRLFQCDFVIMDRHEGFDEHLLVGAVLCFPASWRLSEKAGRPLTQIHGPVTEYDASVAKRVQRLFDGVQVGRPLWRFNGLWYHDPELFQPRSRNTPLGRRAREAPFYRSERQTILRLPCTRACVFVIHTYILRAEDAF